MAYNTSQAIVTRKDYKEEMLTIINGHHMESTIEAENLLLKKRIEFLKKLKTEAPEVPSKVFAEIIAGSNHAFKSCIATDCPNNISKAFCASFSIMHEIYFRKTDRGRRDECEDRISQFVRGFYITSAEPENYHDEIIEKLIAKFYANLYAEEAVCPKNLLRNKKKLSERAMQKTIYFFWLEASYIL